MPTHSDEGNGPDPVEILAREYSTRLQRGESPTITEYVLQYPQFSEEIQNLFPMLDVSERPATMHGKRTEDQ